MPSLRPARLDSRLFLLQSAQILLGSSFSKFLIVCWFWAAFSAAGFGGRLDIVGARRKDYQCCKLLTVCVNTNTLAGEWEMPSKRWKFLVCRSVLVAPLTNAGREIPHLALNQYAVKFGTAFQMPMLLWRRSIKAQHPLKPEANCTLAPNLQRLGARKRACDRGVLAGLAH